jgi:hypothetical protein
LHCTAASDDSAGGRSALGTGAVNASGVPGSGSSGSLAHTGAMALAVLLFTGAGLLLATAVGRPRAVRAAVLTALHRLARRLPSM